MCELTDLFLTIRDNIKGPCMFKDVSISGVRNMMEKEAEKVLKYVV